ncbi:MAG: Trm112 family protein [Planctomycetota bacterium]
MAKNIDDKTLELLRCPSTGSRLTVAEISMINRLNQNIESGQIFDCSGRKIDAPIEGALVNADQSLAMPIRLGVISLSTERAIPLKSESGLDE